MGALVLLARGSEPQSIVLLPPAPSPPGSTVAAAREANVIFFEKKEGRAEAWTDKL